MVTSNLRAATFTSNPATRSGRPSFRDVLEKGRPDAARTAWAKAALASRLRHLVQESWNARGAAVLGLLKIRNISRACKLAPASVRISIGGQ